MKYTRKLTAQICELIENAVPMKHAAITCGISQQTLWRWLKEKSEFSEKLDQAKSRGIAKLVQEIRMDKSFQAKQFLLTCWDPESFHIQSQQLANALDKAKKLEDRVKELEIKERQDYGQNIGFDGAAVPNRAAPQYN